MPKDENEATTLEVDHSNTENITSNPPKKKFFSKEKFSYVLSKEFIIILLLGQFLSLCITATIVANEKLSMSYNANFPTTLTLLTYILLLIVYAPITIYKVGLRGWINTLKVRWWKYIILSFVDVEGNYFVVKAYSYTSVLSIMLLDAWQTPCVVLLSIIMLKFRYHWSQYLAVVICLLGIGAVIGGDLITKNSGDMDAFTDLAKGDIFCLLGSTFYATSNIIEEYLVKRRPLYEVVAQMGLFGTIISVIQIAIFERNEVANAVWNGPIIGLVIAYNLAMLFLYTGTPVLFRLASAAFFNLSILTSDFYSLVFALYLFGNKMHALYPLAFVGTILGLIIFNIYPAIQPKVEVEDGGKDEAKEEVIREKDIESNNN